MQKDNTYLNETHGPVKSTHYVYFERKQKNDFMLYKLQWIIPMDDILGTADGGTVVKVLRYKSEGRWFDSRWVHLNFSLT
jgi:hypothetical protein